MLVFLVVNWKLLLGIIVQPIWLSTENAYLDRLLIHCPMILYKTISADLPHRLTGSSGFTRLRILFSARFQQ